MHTYQYITKDSNPPVTVITAVDDDNKQYPASFTNPSKQAPWLPALTPDPSIPLKVGEKERGYIQLDMEPDVLFDGEADIKVRDNVVLEHWECLFEKENGKYSRFIDEDVLEGDIYIGKEARLICTPYSFNGSIKLGVADFMGDNLVDGTLVADGGAHFTEGTLEGNIKVNGALVMYIASIYGNVCIEYGNRFSTYEEIQGNNTRPVFESCLFTLSQEYLPDYFEMRGYYPEIAHNWSYYDTGDCFEAGQAETFCFDSVNHESNCKCGLFLPFYLGLVPEAIQYFNLKDKRHPTPMPDNHPAANKTAAELERELLQLIWSSPDIWRNGKNFYQDYKNLTGIDYPKSYEDWLEQMEALTGVNPTTYLPK
jgi:hypothetical protein